MASTLWQWAGRAAVSVPVLVFFKDNVASLGCIEGNSMRPTLNPDSGAQRDRVLLNKFSAVCNDYQRGDVCMLRNPNDNTEWICKRLIAVGGDQVRTRSEDLVTVPRGYGWLEGDNYGEDAGNMVDSNTFGPVPLALIRASVWGVVWPPQRQCKLRREIPKGRVLQGMGRGYGAY